VAPDSRSFVDFTDLSSPGPWHLFCTCNARIAYRFKQAGVRIMSSRVWRLGATAALVVLTFSSASAAQTGAVLSGIVHDRTGEPVSGVVLTIVDPLKRDTRVVLTDLRGKYFVDRLHYGVEYAIDLSHPRFRHSRVRATANEGEKSVDIIMVPPRSRLVSVALFPLRVLGFGWVTLYRPELSQ
jgi:hypothetical protein